MHLKQELMTMEKSGKAAAVEGEGLIEPVVAIISPGHNGSKYNYILTAVIMA